MVAAAVLALLAGVACHRSAAGSASVVDYRASSFQSGRPVSLAGQRGHPVLLTSWATWCAECRKEMPVLERFWERHRASGLVMVGVNVDGGGGGRLAKEMASDWGLTMDLWVDSEGTFASTFATLGVPASALVDGSGALVRVWQGGIDLHDPSTEALLDRTIGGGG